MDNELTTTQAFELSNAGQQLKVFEMQQRMAHLFLHKSSVNWLNSFFIEAVGLDKIGKLPRKMQKGKLSARAHFCSSACTKVQL